MLLTPLYLTLCLINVKGDQINFPTSFEKKDFHITTLKDPNFEHEEEDAHIKKTTKETANPEEEFPEECPDFSPGELKKLKQDFNNDGAHVEYVSADALPVDKKEIKNAKCLKKLATKEANEKKLKSTFDSPVKFENRTAGKPKNDTKNGVNDEAKRRGNEYQFDTLEYYDEENIQVADDLCPGLVDVIDLELAEIRRYDIECEKICEWSSLYDMGTFLD